MAAKSKALATVHNALTLLEAFTVERPEWGVRELARAYALPQATTSRLVGALHNEGFLTQTPAKRYRLDMLLHEIGVSAARGSELYTLALPEIARIRVASGFATTLTVLDGFDSVIIERLGDFEERNPRSPRKRWPAYATSGGKVMLAFASEAFIEDVLLRPKEACTPKTRTERTQIANHLEEIRRDVLATEVEESQLGWYGFGVPIFNGLGVCAGALAVEIPQASWNPATSAKTIALVRSAAQTIGAELS